MSPQQETFCRLIAGGRHTQTAAAEESGYSKKTARKQASKLLTKGNIKKRVAELRERHSKAADVDAKWIREQLVKVVDKSSQAIPVMIKVDGELVESGEYKYDSAGVKGALDILNRMGGHYEKDNEQKQQAIELKMTF